MGIDWKDLTEVDAATWTLWAGYFIDRPDTSPEWRAELIAERENKLRELPTGPTPGETVH